MNHGLRNNLYLFFVNAISLFSSNLSHANCNPTRSPMSFNDLQGTNSMTSSKRIAGPAALTWMGPVDVRTCPTELENNQKHAEIIENVCWDAFLLRQRSRSENISKFRPMKQIKPVSFSRKLEGPEFEAFLLDVRCGYRVVLKQLGPVLSEWLFLSYLSDFEREVSTRAVAYALLQSCVSTTKHLFLFLPQADGKSDLPQEVYPRML
eukprot:752938-Hanusia_phi.AAC.6